MHAPALTATVLRIKFLRVGEMDMVFPPGIESIGPFRLPRFSRFCAAGRNRTPFCSSCVGYEAAIFTLLWKSVPELRK